MVFHTPCSVYILVGFPAPTEPSAAAGYSHAISISLDYSFSFNGYNIFSMQMSDLIDG